MRRRAIGAVMSAIIEIGALSVDLAGVEINGSRLPLSAVALVAFLVFVAMVAWQIWELNSELHTDQKRLTITVTPSHIGGKEALLATFFEHPDGTSLVGGGFLTITVRNAANHEIRIGEIFIEAYRRTHWGRLKVARLLFTTWGDNLNWYNAPHRERVEWLIPARSTAIEIDAQYESDIPNGVGKNYKLRLVTTIGKTDRRIVIPFWPRQ